MRFPVVKAPPTWTVAGSIGSFASLTCPSIKADPWDTSEIAPSPVVFPIPGFQPVSLLALDR